MKSLLNKTLSSLLLVIGLLVIVTALATVSMAQEIQGKVSGVRAGTLVYVDWIKGQDYKGEGKHVQIDQRGMKFIPHSIILLRGTTVDFLNSDPVGHNVYWKSPKPNNLGTWPQGETKSFTFWDPGLVTLFCNVHQEMSGFIYVVPTPFYAQVKADGSFVIRGVPQTHVTLRTMGGPNKSKDVDVGSGVNNVEF